MRANARTSVVLLGVVLVVSSFLAACREDDATQSSAAPTQDGSATQGERTVGEDPAVDLADLPEESLATPPAMRLADDLIPPTNRWFSGLVFPEEAQPVFPSPLSYTPTATGFAVGVPRVSTSAATLMGSAQADVTVDAGTDGFVVSRYDDASVTVTLGSGDTNDGGGGFSGILDVVLAEGSPVVGLRARAAAVLTFTASSWEPLDEGGKWRGTSASGRAWVLTVPSSAEVQGGTLSVSVDADEGAALVAAPDGVTPRAGDAVAEASAVESVQATASLTDDQALTRLDYSTAGGRPTLLTSAPHQDGCGTTVGTYASVSGQLSACSGTSLEWGVPLVEATDRLDLSGLTASERDELSAQVRRDAEAHREMPADTYYGGKALQREASLLLLAEELDLDEVAATLRSRLAEELRTWADPTGCTTREERCFTYDPVQHLVVGRAVSFGSETANDVHFHLGYFLGAAAMVGAADPSLVQEIAPVIDALAQTVGAGSTTSFSPRLRTFDTYWSHSWASGWAPFADGNNQESVSEAVNAWNGLALWARVRGETALEDRATWMLSMEAHASSVYWTDVDRSQDEFDGFEHSVVSLVWGGKRDWATWFSPEPSAMLGILVIPASPVADYLATGSSGDGARIRENLGEALGTSSDYDVLFGDQLLMYRSLAGPDDAAQALEIARELPDERIDDGNTRSYLLAFLMAHLR